MSDIRQLLELHVGQEAVLAPCALNELITADRRSVGTGIAAMSEEGSGILSGDAVERGRECLFQSLDGACGDPAEVGFHLGPTRLDRAEVRTVGRQIAIGKA